MQQKIDNILQYLLWMNVKVIEKVELVDLLNKALRGYKFRVKIGITPNDCRLHIGHGLLFCIAKQLQYVGGIVDIVVADFAASLNGIIIDKKKIRRSFKKQIGRFLDMDSVRIVFQTEWIEKIGLDKMISIASYCDTRILWRYISRKTDLSSEKILPLSRLIYFLIGGYDSIAFETDIEIVGEDQEFIVLLSRSLQENHCRPIEVGLLIPHLFGKDGKKMGNSENNCIYLSDSLEKIKKDICEIPENVIHFAKEIEKNIL
ncbi:hypothetical protein KJ684_01330 [Patescibacteria group bacterium]|nr:hypothetical protein [Patescibacteria group bacterium]